MSEAEDIDLHIAALHERAGEYLDACLFRSAYRVYGEIERLARAERRVVPFINAVFHRMDLAQSLLDPRTTRDNAVALLPLLEDEERARQVQPDLPAAAYEHQTAWMTACVYENLAEAAGLLEGYNSAGMHECITDGVEVCRRTGKLACVHCFREYAAQVYTAAEDLEMALHHARLIATNAGPYPDRGDRRHVGARIEGWLLLLRGQVEAAEACLRRAVVLCAGERVSIPLSGRLHALTELQGLLLLGGKPLPPTMPAEQLPEGERPDLELRRACGDAIRACCAGDWPAAIGILSVWDRRLSAQGCTHDWFEARLRLIAAHRLAGDAERAAALARPLEQRARKARDWLTVRRLARLRDAGAAPSPVAALAPLSSGPFAGAAKTAVEFPALASALTSSAPVPAETLAPPAQGPPLEELFQRLVARLEVAEEADRADILTVLLALPPAEVTHPVDAARLLHLIRYVVGDGKRGAAAWRWGEAVAAGFPQAADVLNLLALLGDTIRGTDPALAKEIRRERVEQLLRQSLDLDPDSAVNHARAGAYFLSAEEHGEAERCLARSFRLQRDNGFVALRLAQVYQLTERPRDALAALDLCLREGCADAQVAWEAALAAFRLKQFDLQLTYLDQFESLAEADVWACYYRATALLELGRPEEALAALAEADRRDPGKLFPVEVLRGCAAGVLGRVEPFREHLARVLQVRLATVDYLTVTGLASLFERLWKEAARLPEDDPLRGALYERLLRSGLAAEALFEAERHKAEETEGINYYRCMVRQPLDERWAESEGCLAGQQTWTAYYLVWGVLARDEKEAKRRVLEWQRRCYPLPARVAEIELEEGGYRDRPGVVWQGARWAASEGDEGA